MVDPPPGGLPTAALAAGRLCRRWRFGAHRLDEREHRLTREGRMVELTPKAFALLVHLVERSGRLVRREELMTALWPDTFVEDGTLARHVSSLRSALGPDAALVETVPKLGYRFAGAVEEASEAESSIAAPPLPLSPIASPESGPRAGLASAFAARPLFWLVLALVVLGAVWLGPLRRPPRAAPATLDSVAVLPFTSIGERGEDDHLELGLADELILELSRLARLEVRPLGAVAGDQRATTDPVGFGRALGVDAVLAGTLRRQEGRLRVTARLLATRDGRALWSGSFDHADRELLAVERAIGREASLALLPSLGAGFESEATTVDPEAHDLYLRARYFWSKRTAEALRQSVALFDRALVLDPDYAAAEAGLAAAKALLAGPVELYEEARRHAARALALDPRSADAHAVLGLVAENYDADWARAESEYEAALALQPNHPTATHWYGEMLVLLGRFDEGDALLERAARLDPLSLAIASDRAKAGFVARRWDDAVARAEEVLAMDPQFAWAWGWLGVAELRRGRVDRAVEATARLAELEPSPLSQSFSVEPLAAAGRHAEAHAVREEVEGAARAGYVPSAALVLARLGDGDREGALDALDALFARRENRLGLSTLPQLDVLREEPRFRAMLLRVEPDAALTTRR